MRFLFQESTGIESIAILRSFLYCVFVACYDCQTYNVFLQVCVFFFLHCVFVYYRLKSVCIVYIISKYYFDELSIICIFGINRCHFLGLCANDKCQFYDILSTSSSSSFFISFFKIYTYIQFQIQNYNIIKVHLTLNQTKYTAQCTNNGLKILELNQLDKPA